jgi:hypothetical protein
VSPPQAPKTKDTASAGGGVRIPACTSSPTVLAEIRRLTDPVTGTVDGARRVVGLVPTLALCSDVDQVEAQLRLAEAYFTLSQSTRACAVLRRIEPQAAATPFAANVGLYLSHCR